MGILAIGEYIKKCFCCYTDFRAAACIVCVSYHVGDNIQGI